MSECLFNIEALLKKRLQYKCFPANFAKLLRALFYIEHLSWLLLLIEKEQKFQEVVSHKNPGHGPTAEKKPLKIICSTKLVFM